MKMKKILSLFIVVIMVMSLATACGKKEDEATETKTDATDEATTETTTEEKEEVDAVTTASIVDNGDALVSALSADGTWIVATLNDVVTDKEIIVDGLFYDKDDTTSDIYRKLAPYTQDDDHNIVDQFTITAPKMTVRSENFKIQGGTFVGDVYVEANGFNVSSSATIEGNVYFATQENMDSMIMDDSAVITGSKEVAMVDVVTTASIVNDGDALVSALAADGTWIVATLNDVVTDKEIIVDGLFYDKDDTTSDIYRKLAPYTQDDDHNIVDQFTITAPKMTVKSENFKIQGGTFIGDVYVEANGFNVSKAATIEGNVYFATQENMDSMIMDDSAVITGTKEVK